MLSQGGFSGWISMGFPAGSASKESTWPLGGEDPLEKGMTNHSSVHSWRLPWTEKPGGLQSRGCKESGTTERLTLTYLLTCFFYDPTDVGNLISSSSAFSKSSLNIWKFMVRVLLKPGLENFEHYFASVWDECNCVLIWAFFGIAFLWDWNENWPFLVLWPLLSFPNLLAYWVQHFHSIIF